MSKIIQRLEHKQKLNPRQILESSIMQLNSYVLEKRILEEVENNPTLDIDEEENQIEENDNSDESEFNWEDLISNPEDYNLSSKQGIASLENKSNKISLVEDFTMQLNDLNLKNEELLISELVLGNLDDSGYLTIEPILIADKLSLDEKKVLDVIELIKTLDPVGIGSRSLQECLLVQLRINYPKEFLAIKVIDDFFNDFKNHNYSRIIDKVSCDSKTFNDVLKLISVLSPRPGIMYSDAKNEHIVPDVVANKNKGKWEIGTNNISLPKITINNNYKEMLTNKNTSKDVKNFLKQKIESANWFMDAVSSRYNTISKIMHSIIKFQKSYFDSDKRELKPLIMKTIAKDINMDISTISRATNDKYVQLPWGCYELKSFFSEGIQTKDGDIVSNTVIKDIIKDIIINENEREPYTDQQIMEILIEKKYNIARRTVAKYRESLKLPIARLRKKDI